MVRFLYSYPSVGLAALFIEVVKDLALLFQLRTLKEEKYSQGVLLI